MVKNSMKAALYVNGDECIFIALGDLPITQVTHYTNLSNSWKYEFDMEITMHWQDFSFVIFDAIVFHDEEYSSDALFDACAEFLLKGCVVARLRFDTLPVHNSNKFFHVFYAIEEI